MCEFCRREEEEERAAASVLFCLELRRITILLLSDIWKRTVTHSVKEWRGAKSQWGLVDLRSKQAKIPGRCRVFYVIMWRGSSLTSGTFTSFTLCPLLHLCISFFFFFFFLFPLILFFWVSGNAESYQPVSKQPQWCAASIPCWQKGEHFTKEQMDVEICLRHIALFKDDNEIVLKTSDRGCESEKGLLGWTEAEERKLREFRATA